MRLASIRPQVKKLALISPATVKFHDAGTVTGDLAGVTLHIVGKDSKSFQDFMLSLSRERDELKAKGKDLDPLEVGRKVIVASVVGCDEEDAFDGPYTPEKLDDLLKTGEYGWLAEQVNFALQDRASFFPGSVTNS